MNTNNQKIKKIAIIGCSGAGKTTLANKLHTLLHIPVYHLDQIYWEKNWHETTLDHARKKHTHICTQTSWIIDGNNMSTLEERISYADTIIFLDISRLTCLYRIFLRWAKFRTSQRPDVPAGCFDNLNKKFLLHIWNYNKKFRPRILALLKNVAAHKRVYIVKSATDPKLRELMP